MKLIKTMSSIKLKRDSLKIRAGKNKIFLMPKFSKGQLKIQEMAFMIIAVILFFVLAGLFALSILYTNLSKQATELAEQRTLSSISNLAASPEFNCPGSTPNCVDADKLMALTQKKAYADFWPFSSLKVIRTSALIKNETDRIQCNIANYPDCDVFVVYDDKVDENTISSFVALCWTAKENSITYTKCEMAILAAGTRTRVPGN